MNRRRAPNILIMIGMILSTPLIGRGYGGGGHGGTHGGGFGHAGGFEHWGSYNAHGFGNGYGGIDGSGEGFGGGEFGGDSGGFGQRSHVFGYGGTGFNAGNGNLRGRHIAQSSTIMSPIRTLYGPAQPIHISETSLVAAEQDNNVSYAHISHHARDPHGRTGIDKVSGTAWGAWSTYGDWSGPWGGWWGPVWWQWNLGWPYYKDNGTLYTYPRDEGKSILLNANHADSIVTYNGNIVTVMHGHTIQIPKKSLITVTRGNQEAHFTTDASYYAIQPSDDSSFTIIAYDDEEEQLD